MSEVKAIIISKKDTVATCMYGAEIGDTVHCVGSSVEKRITCTQSIPPYHKIAMKVISKGEAVYKYGEIIGAATEDIEMGGWVSDANLSGLSRNYETELL